MCRISCTLYKRGLRLGCNKGILVGVRSLLQRPSLLEFVWLEVIAGSLTFSSPLNGFWSFMLSFAQKLKIVCESSTLCLTGYSIVISTFDKRKCLYTIISLSCLGFKSVFLFLYYALCVLVLISFGGMVITRLCS